MGGGLEPELLLSAVTRLVASMASQEEKGEPRQTESFSLN